MEGVDLKYPDALPDGSGLLLTINRGNDLLRSWIAVVGPEGGEVRELFRGAMARYAESGHIVYTTAEGTLMAAPFDLRSLQVTGRRGWDGRRFAPPRRGLPRVALNASRAWAARLEPT